MIIGVRIHKLLASLLASPPSLLTRTVIDSLDFREMTPGLLTQVDLGHGKGMELELVTGSSI